MQNLRPNLINLIARCNSQEVRRNWIHEMVSLTDIECSESQCTGCPIEKDCIAVCEIGGAYGTYIKVRTDATSCKCVYQSKY